MSIKSKHQMNRRDFNRRLASLGLVASTGPILSRAAFAAAEDHPTLFTWEGYEEPPFHQQYVNKHGEMPNFSFFGDEEEAFAKIRAGFKPDLVQPCSYKVELWKDAGILQPIDTSRLSNFDDLIPGLKTIPGMVIDGVDYCVCSDWGQTSVIYREDLVDIEEESWTLLWDPRYTGRLTMQDNLIDGVMVAAIVAGAADPFNMTDAEVAKTKELLAEQLPLLRNYVSSSTELQQMLASGEIVAGVGWNDSFSALKAEGVPVKFMNPKEGLMTWTCGLSILSAADPAKLDKTYDMIDSMISPEAGAFEMMDFGYGHANSKAYDLLTEEELAGVGLTRDPQKQISDGIFQEPIGNESVLQPMFDEVRAGI